MNQNGTWLKMKGHCMWTAMTAMSILERLQWIVLGEALQISWDMVFFQEPVTKYIAVAAIPLLASTATGGWPSQQESFWKFVPLQTSQSRHWSSNSTWFLAVFVATAARCGWRQIWTNSHWMSLVCSDWDAIRLVGSEPPCCLLTGPSADEGGEPYHGY